MIVAVSRDAGGVLLSVADNGPGILPDEQALIFEPFFRGAAAKKRPGTGMGLAIVKQVAEAHGGHVTVQSAPGQGTTFKVCLPAGEQPQ